VKIRSVYSCLRTLSIEASIQKTKSFKNNTWFMPIRNLWSLECGEVLTAEAIIENVKGSEVYFPLHDIGTDLLVVKGKNHVSIQVKESRYFTKRVLKGTLGHSWHQLSKKKFLRDKGKVDFYIFLTYLLKVGEHRFNAFENKFIIIPTSELDKRIKTKNCGKKEIYSFYFNFEGKKVVEKRDVVTDYSEYLNRWNLIKEALEWQECKE
jgi:hypothetical protein